MKREIADELNERGKKPWKMKSQKNKPLIWQAVHYKALDLNKR